MIVYEILWVIAMGFLVVSAVDLLTTSQKPSG